MILHSTPDIPESLGFTCTDPQSLFGKHFPDFLIIGPWRTGTTWLSEMIRHHPDCFMTDPKEPHYFNGLSGKGRYQVPSDLQWYLDLFANAGDKRSGEATASYAYHLSEEMIRWIFRVNPEIKIIMGVREPVERAWSHIKMNLPEPPQAFAHLSEPELIRKLIGAQYVAEAGMYSKLIGKWTQVIPKENFYVFRFDHLLSDAASAFTGVCKFLEIDDRLSVVNTLCQRIGKVAGTVDAPMPANIKRQLTARYRHELVRLRKVYGIRFHPAIHASFDRKPVVLVPNKNLSYSETFIINHARSINADMVSLSDYLPMIPRKHPSPFKMMYRNMLSLRNQRRLHSRLRKAGGSLLFEFGTSAATALPVIRKTIQRVVIHFHGFDVYRTDLWNALQDTYTELFHRADALVVVSEHMRRHLLQIGAPHWKVHHIVCGVDPEFFTQADVASNSPVFFACGRFVDKKAPHITIRAFHRAWQQNPEIRLILAGEGPLYSACHALVRELGMPEVVQMPGQITHQQVAAYLQGCRAFLQHSVVAQDGDMEGTPVGILEAGMSAIPVIATKHGGIPDVVTHEVTGLLVDEMDIVGMSEAILNLSRDPAYAAKLGLQARLHVSEDYSLESTIRKLQVLMQ